MIILDLEEEWCLFCKIKNGGSIGGIFWIVRNQGRLILRVFDAEYIKNSPVNAVLTKRYMSANVLVCMMYCFLGGKSA